MPSARKSCFDARLRRPPGPRSDKGRTDLAILCRPLAKRARAVALGLTLAGAYMTPAAADLFESQDGSTEDQVNPTRPPNFVVVPNLKLSARTALPNGFSFEAFTRTAIGLAGSPFVTQVSGSSGGFGLSKSFGDWNWSTGFEIGVGYSRFYDVYSNMSYEWTTGLGRTFAFEGTPWSIGPKVTVGYRWSSDRAKERVRFELAMPVFYKINERLDAVFIPRFDHRIYSNPEALGRRDWVGNLAVGLRYQVASGALLSGFLAFENRASTRPEIRYSRWIIAPQLSLRMDF